MPKIVSDHQIEQFLADIAAGMPQKVAAPRHGFKAGTASMWAKTRPGFKERLAEAHEAGKAARRARLRVQTREMLSIMVGGRVSQPNLGSETPPGGISSIAMDEIPAADQVGHPGKPDRPQRRVPIGRVDAQGIIWADEALLRLIVGETARAIGHAQS